MGLDATLCARARTEIKHRKSEVKPSQISTRYNSCFCLVGGEPGFICFIVDKSKALDFFGNSSSRDRAYGHVSFCHFLPLAEVVDVLWDGRRYPLRYVWSEQSHQVDENHGPEQINS
jgi:hypothetical protein